MTLITRIPGKTKSIYRKGRKGRKGGAAKPTTETRRHRGPAEIESIGIHLLISEIRAITCDQRYGVVISAVQLSARGVAVNGPHSLTPLGKKYQCNH